MGLKVEKRIDFLHLYFQRWLTTDYTDLHRLPQKSFIFHVPKFIAAALHILNPKGWHYGSLDILNPDRGDIMVASGVNPGQMVLANKRRGGSFKMVVRYCAVVVVVIQTQVDRRLHGFTQIASKIVYFHVLKFSAAALHILNPKG